MKRLLSLVAVLLFAPCLVYALDARDQMLTLNLGMAVPLNVIDMEDVGGGEAMAGSAGFTGGAQYLYVLNPRFAIGGEFNVTQTGTEEDEDLLYPAESEVTVKSTVLLAIARLNLAKSKKAIPFLFLGLGIHNTHLQIDIHPPVGYYWLDTNTTEDRAVVDSDASGVAFATGGGCDFLINEHFFLGVEGRLQFLGSTDYEATTFGEGLIDKVEGTFTHLNVLARIGYRFGGPRKAPVTPA